LPSNPDAAGREERLISLTSWTNLARGERAGARHEPKRVSRLYHRHQAGSSQSTP